MGMFDEVKVPCPYCGTIHLAQSKGGECALIVYELDEAPVDVLSDINRHPMICERCGGRFKAVVQCVVSVVGLNK